MRKILGPVLLVILALISLLLLQQQKGSEPTATPPPSSTTSATRPPTPRVSPPPSSTSSTSSPRVSTPTLPPSPGADGEGEGSPVPATATPTPAGTAQAAHWASATALAGRFLKAFARPAVGTSPAAWWSSVQPYLTTQAVADYAGTDPANVPFTATTGPGVIVPVDAPDSLVTAVLVPTDAGPYLVEIRSTPDGLRVARATPQARR